MTCPHCQWVNPADARFCTGCGRPLALLCPRIGKAIETLYQERLEEYYEVLAHHYGRSGHKDKAVEYLELC